MDVYELRLAGEDVLLDELRYPVRLVVEGGDDDDDGGIVTSP